MSGYGHRKAAVLVDATAWRDRVIDDVLRGKGRAAARANGVSVDLVIAGAEIIAAYMAAGESEISRTDLRRSGVRSVPLICVRQMQRLLRYLEARDHLERVDRAKHGERRLRCAITTHDRQFVDDINATPCVCFEAQTGKHLLGLNLTAFDPERRLRNPSR